MRNAIYLFFNRSITRLVMASFVFVLLFPLGFLISTLPEESWGSVKREILEKHLLIAESVEESVSLFFLSQQKSSQIFSNTSNIVGIKDQDERQNLLDDYVRSLDNVVVVSYLSLDDYSKVVSVKDSFKAVLQNPRKVREEPILNYLSFGNRHHTIRVVSPVFRSTVSNQPVVLLKTYLYDKKFNKKAILFAEVRLAYINNLCGKINLSGKEHCTIVDSEGRVIANPNQEWVDEIKDLSKSKVVQDVKRGNSGTMTFFNQFQNEEVIAGYTIINKLGWGVIISQPKLNLDSPLNQVMLTIFKWLVIGIILALVIAYVLTRQIIKPVNQLVRKSLEADIRSDSFNLGAIPKNTPMEISQLWNAISSLVSRLQESNRKVVQMNYSLNQDIEKATKKLRETNRHLYAISSKDHLTRIANRRYFEDIAGRIISQKIGERASVILIDVDKFKFINDEYGHEAGDMALVHIAKLMHKCTRKGDIPARLGGDEFVIYIRNCGPRALCKVAENLRETVEKSPIYWNGIKINLTLSVGIVNCEITKNTTLTQLLKFADKAMYISKKKGRNCVTPFSKTPVQYRKAG